MIIRDRILIEQLSGDYSGLACNLGRMVRKGEMIRLKHGLYGTKPSTPPYLVAQNVYGSSYISFEYALMRHKILGMGKDGHLRHVQQTQGQEVSYPPERVLVQRRSRSCVQHRCGDPGAERLQVRHGHTH